MPNGPFNTGSTGSSGGGGAPSGPASGDLTGTYPNPTVDVDKVTFAKIQNITTDRLVGRDTAGSGDPEEIAVTGGLEFTGSTGIQRSALTGDVTASAGSGATTIATAAVTLAKMANLATDRLIGRDTAGTGVPEALTVGGGIEFTGSTGIQRSALTGDVTASAGSGTTTIVADAVTYAKIQNVSATDRLLGRDTAGAGDIEELTVSGGVEFTGTGIQRSALTGDVTATAGSNATTIASNAVTYAKLQDISATDRLLGRDTAGSGDTEELTVSGGVEFTGSAGIQRSALTGEVTATAGSNTTTVAAAVTSSTASGIPRADGSGVIATAWLPAGTTSAKGTVELATDGETASGVVVQGNDSRLASALEALDLAVLAL